MRITEPMPQGRSLASLLGWFGLGLGLAQIASPRGMTRMVGVRDDAWNRHAMLAIGLREIASGAGILARRRPENWLWARVGGDVMDLALLAAASTSARSSPKRLAMAGAAVLGVLALDYVGARQQSGRGGFRR